MVSNKYDFKQIESDVEAHWQHIAPLIKHTTVYDAKKPLFSFLEGPPTANAPPALHHVEVRVFKDVMCRFKYMQGYSVPRKGGWDCHGLPVEVQVEKKLGLETKKDVLTYGIKEFNEKCRTDIFTYIKDWEAMTKKLAYVIDLENPYRTLDNTYIESVWWSLKELHKKGMLYEGHKVVPYCPRCETPLSSHEVALGYRDVTEDTVVVKMEDVEKPGRYYLVWTTTPWTLPANVCLAVNPNVEYAIVKKGDSEFVLAQDLVDTYFEKGEYTLLDIVKGNTLVGKKYKPLFPYYADKDAFWIVNEDYVTTEDGTGIVHQAPAFGEVDYESTQRHGLPFLQNVQSNGAFDDTVTDFKGIFVKKADPEIISWLDANAKLFTSKKYTHSYPFCWRCSTPLIYYALNSWFIASSKIRDRMVALNQNIQWAPGHIKDGRFGKWLEGAKDWALSRFKFWGTPLPVWRCECGEIDVIGSVKELNDRRFGSDFAEDLTLDNLDLHKPAVDDIKIQCNKCSKAMSRIPDVIDCWYDSGAAPFAQYHYPFENKELFEKSAPYSFISEAIDQTRGWFYTMHVISTILFDDVAYKRCYVGGLLCDDKGEKMSKSKGNILDPFAMFDEYGVDAVRLQMCAYPLGENLKFGKSSFKDVINPFLRILWNSFYFCKEYFRSQGVSERCSSKSSLRIEDEWILSRLYSTTQAVEDALDSGKYNLALSSIQKFVEEDFSRGYIKLVRGRAKEQDDGISYVFTTVLETTVKLLAPFAPYVSDAMYRNLWPAKESVHLDEWPEVDAIQSELETQMSIVQDVLSAINYAREKAKLGGRWPVKHVMVESTTPTVVDAIHKLQDILKGQANVKVVETCAKMDGVMESVLLNMGALQREFKQDGQTVIAELTKIGPDKVWAVIQSDSLYKLGDRKITKDHFKIVRTHPDHLIEAKSKYGYVYLDKTRTPELDAEGYAREVVRRVQDIRKKQGMTKDQEIRLQLCVTQNFEDALFTWKDYIAKSVGAVELSILCGVDTHKWHHREEFKIKELKGTASLNVIGLEKDFM
jgi:isoleucyl-tRNA synthetase